MVCEPSAQTSGTLGRNTALGRIPYRIRAFHAFHNGRTCMLHERKYQVPVLTRSRGALPMKGTAEERAAELFAK